MRLLRLFVTVLLCMILSVAVFAHPGRTDSKGGHTDHSTGEYHFHHGYSAHHHTDKDGDGDLDCPFDFDDKTGSSASNSSSFKDSTKPTAETESSEKKDTSSDDTWNKRKIKDYWYPIIGCFILYAVILVVDEIKWRLKK